MRSFFLAGLDHDEQKSRFKQKFKAFEMDFPINTDSPNVDHIKAYVAKGHRAACQLL